MSIKFEGKTYYRTNEACQIAGISRSTFFRWLKSGLYADVKIIDRRGWRLFTEEDLERLNTEANQITLRDSKQEEP